MAAVTVMVRAWFSRLMAVGETPSPMAAISDRRTSHSSLFLVPVIISSGSVSRVVSPAASGTTTTGRSLPSTERVVAEVSARMATATRW